MNLIFFPILFLGGLIAGLYAPGVGGGALITFPLLILAGLPIPIAIATNRFGAIFLELTSAAQFHRAKELKIKTGLLFGVIAASGSVIGANLVVQINAKILNIIVAVAFALVLLAFLYNDKIKSQEKKIKHHHVVLALIFTFLLGIYGGFFGVGFGTFMMFPFILFGYSLIKSAAISRIVGFIMCVASASIFAYHGLINYAYGLTLGLSYAIGAWVGADLAIKKGYNYIKPLLIVIVLITIIKLLLSFFGIEIL